MMVSRFRNNQGNYQWVSGLRPRSENRSFQPQPEPLRPVLRLKAAILAAVKSLRHLLSAEASAGRVADAY